jgi:hypothetical protein
MAGRRLYDDLVRELPVPFEFRAEGGLIYFTTPEQGRVFEEFVARRRDDGLDMELIDGAEVRRQVGPIRPDVLGASFCANDAQINTPTVVAANDVSHYGVGLCVQGVTVTDPGPGGRPGRGRRDGRRTGRGRHGRHRDRCVDQQPLAAQDVAMPVGMERLQVLATVPARSTSTRGLRTAGGQAVQPVPGPAVVGRARVPRPTRSSPGGGCSSCVAAGQRRGPARLPDGLPAQVTHEVTLSGLRDTATAISEDFPGLRDVGSTGCGPACCPSPRTWCRSSTRSPGLFVAAGHVFGNAPGDDRTGGAAAPRQGAGRRP